MSLKLNSNQLNNLNLKRMIPNWIRQISVRWRRLKLKLVRVSKNINIVHISIIRTYVLIQKIPRKRVIQVEQVIISPGIRDKIVWYIDAAVLNWTRRCHMGPVPISVGINPNDWEIREYNVFITISIIALDGRGKSN